jgi:hypothetical protein
MEEKQPDISPTDDSQGDISKIVKRKKGRTKRVYDPTTSSNKKLPTERLSTKADSKAVTKRVNELTTIVGILATNLSALSEHYGQIRRRRDFDMSEIATLARKGMGKNSIAKLLGFEACMFSQRKDLEEAFDIGRAELEVVVADRQLELMMTTKGPILPIFLGKNYLGQKDTPDTQVNVQVNVGTESKEKLASKFLSKSADLAKIEAISTPQVVEAEFTDATPVPKDGEK